MCVPSGLGTIGFSENSGNESWLQRNEVYVFSFEGEFDVGFSAASGNSLPFGNHISSSDFTAFFKSMTINKQYIKNPESANN